MRRIIFIALISILLFTFQTPLAVSTNCSDSNNRVSLCDLVRDPERYEGKPVVVSATFQLGYESEEIYCLGCTNWGRIWVEFGNETAADKIRVDESQLIPGCAFDVIFSGSFYATGKRYGHLNSFRYKFVVESVKRAKLILNNANFEPSEWPTKAQKKVCGYEKGPIKENRGRGRLFNDGVVPK
jgi:hypothetical protein